MSIPYPSEVCIDPTLGEAGAGFAYGPFDCRNESSRFLEMPIDSSYGAYFSILARFARLWSNLARQASCLSALEYRLNSEMELGRMLKLSLTLASRSAKLALSSYY